MATVIYDEEVGGISCEGELLLLQALLKPILVQVVGWNVELAQQVFRSDRIGGNMQLG